MMSLKDQFDLYHQLWINVWLILKAKSKVQKRSKTAWAEVSFEQFAQTKVALQPCPFFFFYLRAQLLYLHCSLFPSLPPAHSLSLCVLGRLDVGGSFGCLFYFTGNYTASWQQSENRQECHMTQWSNPAALPFSLCAHTQTHTHGYSPLINRTHMMPTYKPHALHANLW